MTNRSTSADFVTAFATGWPENQPDIMVLSLTTHKGVQDFAFNKEQALLIARDHQGNRSKAGEAQDQLSERSNAPAGADAERAVLTRYFDSEILAPRNWLSARIVTDCLLPLVCSEMLALKPAALATTWKLPPPPRPCKVPLMLRLASLQVPETVAALGDDIGLQIELVGVAGAGEGHFHVGARDRIGRAAADALARAVVEGDGAAAGPACRPCRRTARTGRGSAKPANGRKKTRRPRMPAAAHGRRVPMSGWSYWRDASHRPLHGTPADAPFHFPDPELPLS